MGKVILEMTSTPKLDWLKSACTAVGAAIGPVAGVAE